MSNSVNTIYTLELSHFPTGLDERTNYFSCEQAIEALDYIQNNICCPEQLKFSIQEYVITTVYTNK